MSKFFYVVFTKKMPFLMHKNSIPMSICMDVYDYNTQRSKRLLNFEPL